MKFEVVSVKHAGNVMDGGQDVGGRHYFRPLRGPEFKGVKLSALTPLGNIISYAFSPLVKQQKLDRPDWIYSECYEIPAGTTVDEAKAMLRTALVERLGLRYRLVYRETPIYALVRGGGTPKLAPATGPEPNPGAMRSGAFSRKSASLADFAAFLSSVMDREVVDKTGIQGKYRFDVDWSQSLLETMHEFGPHGDPAIIFAGVKALGLRLEPQKQPQKVIVIDHVNREPTPN